MGLSYGKASLTMTKQRMVRFSFLIFFLSIPPFSTANRDAADMLLVSSEGRQNKHHKSKVALIDNSNTLTLFHSDGGIMWEKEISHPTSPEGIDNNTLSRHLLSLDMDKGVIFLTSFYGSKAVLSSHTLATVLVLFSMPFPSFFVIFY